MPGANARGEATRCTPGERMLCLCPRVHQVESAATPYTRRRAKGTRAPGARPRDARHANDAPFNVIYFAFVLKFPTCPGQLTRARQTCRHARHGFSSFGFRFAAFRRFARALAKTVRISWPASLTNTFAENFLFNRYIIYNSRRLIRAPALSSPAVS